MSRSLRIALMTNTQIMRFKWDGITCKQPELRFASFDGEGGGEEDGIVNVYV